MSVAWAWFIPLGSNNVGVFFICFSAGAHLAYQEHHDAPTITAAIIPGFLAIASIGRRPAARFGLNGHLWKISAPLRRVCDSASDTKIGQRHLAGSHRRQTDATVATVARRWTRNLHRLAMATSSRTTNQNPSETRIQAMEIAQSIQLARNGDERSLGALLSSYERYLKLLAQVQLGHVLRCKVDASDIVQETFLEAHRAIQRFDGTSGEQFVGWLKAILATRLANTMRHYLGTQARDIRLEERICHSLDQSSLSLGDILADPHSSPSQHVVGKEQSQLVAEALLRLSHDYREVIVMRHLEGMTFPEIASAMNRSVDSVEKLWLRGMAKLKREFKAETDDAK